MKAVILAGGTGTRLWPLSRINKPKQFQPLASEKTLFQEAVTRLNFLKPKDIYIATNIGFVDLVKKQAPKIPTKNIIIEPALRDTASCIGLAAAVIAKDHPDEVMVVSYADHLIKDKTKFQKKLKAAEKLAHEEETLNIIEVKAKFPNVNLGYVRIGKMLRIIDEQEIYSFERFIEKPDLKTAKKFLQSYKYLWNTGIYVWKVSTILDAYKKHLPDTYKRLIKIQNAYGTPKQKNIISKEYPACQKISIDYAIMEKVDPKQVRIIPSHLGWSDIGTWLSLHDELSKTPTSNLSKGDQININTKGSIIYNTDPEQLVVTVGLKDIAVINTPNGILICDKHQSQDVKKVIEAIKKKGRTDLL